MRIFALLVGFVAAMAFATTAVLASGPAMHFEEDITGDVFECDDATYTAISGTIRVVIHEGEARNPGGNQNFTGTITPRNVVLEDDEGNTYRIRGAVWFGGTFNGNTDAGQGTFTAFLNIIGGRGGVVDSVRFVGHMSPNGDFFEKDFGTCQLPDEEDEE